MSLQFSLAISWTGAMLTNSEGGTAKELHENPPHRHGVLPTFSRG